MQRAHRKLWPVALRCPVESKYGQHSPDCATEVEFVVGCALVGHDANDVVAKRRPISPGSILNPKQGPCLIPAHNALACSDEAVAILQNNTSANYDPLQRTEG